MLTSFAAKLFRDTKTIFLIMKAAATTQGFIIKVKISFVKFFFSLNNIKLTHFLHNKTSVKIFSLIKIFVEFGSKSCLIYLKVVQY